MSSQERWQTVVEKREAECVVMECCGFTFDAGHADVEGGYTCPLCEPPSPTLREQTYRDALERIIGAPNVYAGPHLRDIAREALSPQPDPPERPLPTADEVRGILKAPPDPEPTVCPECGEVGTHKGTCSKSTMHNPSHPFHTGSDKQERLRLSAEGLWHPNDAASPEGGSETWLLYWKPGDEKWPRVAWGDSPKLGAEGYITIEVVPRSSSAESELERVKLEAAQWEGSFKGMVAVEKELKGEIQRLREALEEAREAKIEFCRSVDDFMQDDTTHDPDVAKAIQRLSTYLNSAFIALHPSSEGE